MFTWLSTFPEASYLCNSYGRYYLCKPCLSFTQFGWKANLVHVPFYCVHDVLCEPQISTIIKFYLVYTTKYIQHNYTDMCN